MSTRVDQKLRTRAALLRAASELVAQGKSPSVAEVAESAQVSTATAYRYFPTQQALLVELPLDEAAPTVASRSCRTRSTISSATTRPSSGSSCSRRSRAPCAARGRSATRYEARAATHC